MTGDDSDRSNFITPLFTTISILFVVIVCIIPVLIGCIWCYVNKNSTSRHCTSQDNTSQHSTSQQEQSQVSKEGKRTVLLLFLKKTSAHE